jgi:hypothetical protein
MCLLQLLTKVDILTTLISQFCDLARCFPLQPEGGTFPGRDFAEAVEDSTSAAPSASHVEKKKRKKAVDADRVEDSEDAGSLDFSKEIEKAFPAEPLDSRPPPKL